jgi:hypothetical protein
MFYIKLSKMVIFCYYRIINRELEANAKIFTRKNLESYFVSSTFFQPLSYSRSQVPVLFQINCIGKFCIARAKRFGQMRVGKAQSLWFGCLLMQSKQVYQASIIRLDLGSNRNSFELSSGSVRSIWEYVS